jgi:hypothetical protein
MRPLFKDVEARNSLHLAVEYYIGGANKINRMKQASRVRRVL